MLTGAAEFAGQQHIDGSSIIWQAMVYDIVRWWLYANIGLGLFNMIPFGPLGGLKVKDWNSNVWLALFLVFLSPIPIYFLTGGWSNDTRHLAIQSGLIKVHGFPWTYRDSSGNTIGEG